MIFMLLMVYMQLTQVCTLLLLVIRMMVFRFMVPTDMQIQTEQGGLRELNPVINCGTLVLEQPILQEQLSQRDLQFLPLIPWDILGKIMSTSLRQDKII